MVTKRRVPYVDLPAQYAEQREAILECIEGVGRVGQFVNSRDIELFEQDIAERVGVRHVIAVASGTDALIVAMRALGLGPGDEVITPPCSFVASTAAIVEIGATPVFADVREDLNIDPTAVAAAITPRTRAIMPVHLTGRIADMNPILEIAGRHGIAVVEDAAQSIGSRYDGRPSGSFGSVGCFSAHPLKSLNAIGDGGYITTDDDRVADFARLYRNVGLADRDTMVSWGRVSRLDAIQASILRHRLTCLDDVIARRRRNVEAYRRLLADVPVTLPVCRANEFNTFHLFIVQSDHRDELLSFLEARSIEAIPHYRVPIHLQPGARDLGYRAGDFPVCERLAGRILSLPIHQYLTEDDIAYVAEAIREFHGRR